MHFGNTKQDLIKLYDIEKSKITVTHLACSSFWSANDQKLDTKINEDFLLYVGQRKGYKNFLGFLKAFSQSQLLKNNFRIIAFGGGQFTAEEKNEIQNLGLNDEHVLQRNGSDLELRIYISKLACLSIHRFMRFWIANIGSYRAVNAPYFVLLLVQSLRLGEKPWRTLIQGI